MNIESHQHWCNHSVLGNKYNGHFSDVDLRRFRTINHATLLPDKKPNSGWLAVKSDVLIAFDLENTPLEIKTDSALGSDEQVYISFFIDPGLEPGDRIGGIQLYFTTSPQYKIGRCSKISDFPTTLPSGTTKIWRITLARTSSEIRITIHCNDEEVLNVVLSDTVCNHPDYEDGKWRMYWEKYVIKKIRFQHSAADYYRAYTPGNEKLRLNYITFRKKSLSDRAGQKIIDDS